MALDDQYRVQWQRMQDERARSSSEEVAEATGDGSGGPPHIPEMQILTARVEALDKRMDRFEGKFDGLDARLRAVETGLATLTGKIDGFSSKLDLIVGKMPSWWQAPVSAGGLVALILGLLALAHQLKLT